MPRTAPAVRRVLFFAVFLGLLASGTGCYGCKKRQVVPRGSVSGKVTLGGENKLLGGIVTFVQVDAPNEVVSVNIRKDGTYKTTIAPVGNCRVSVKTSHFNPAPPPPPPGQTGATPKPPAWYAQMDPEPATVGITYQPIPLKYEDAEKSGLSFDVKAGDNTYDIKLSPQ